MKLFSKTQAKFEERIGQPELKGNLSLLTIIRSIMTVIGTSFLFLALAADAFGIGGLPGFGVRQFALTISGLMLILGAIISLPKTRWKTFSEQLLLVFIAIAVTLIADLNILNTGTVKLIDKLVMFVTVIVSIIVVRTHSTIHREISNISVLGETILSNKNVILRFFLITFQFILFVLLVKEFNLENAVFSHNIMLVAFFGYLFHNLLPHENRLPFFLFISLTTILGVFGSLNGAWLIGIGLVFIGISHLPVQFSARVILLLASGAILAYLRSRNDITLPWSFAIWPILGSMFMFRLIVYMYDLKHQKEPSQIWQTLSYFFLLPNVVFPLFPVVDYSNFRRTYFNENRFRIYQTGLNWMLRGAIQLIVYRFVSYYVLTRPENITNITQLVIYLVANIMLYLRVSGQFHIVIGILHMFGFNLPETNHNYFLASSFTDFWRRINIYWKDFMLKVFYYPFYFRIKHWGATTSLVLATLFVFFVTWLLHAYQWFWLRGTFLLNPQDLLFWMILAILVTVNALYEMKRGRRRTLGKKKMTIREYISLGLRIAGTFGVISIIWSLWTSVSVKEWFAMWSIPLPDPNLRENLFPYVIVFSFLGTFFRKSGGNPQKNAKENRLPSYIRSSFTTGAIILSILLIVNPVILSKLGGQLQQVILDLRFPRLNQQDADLLERGYYEDLMGVNRFNSQLWEIYMKKPPGRVSIFSTDAGRFTGDFLYGELVPSAWILFYDLNFTTNQWGMRDKEYDLHIPPNTYRFALLGQSIPMGWGVADDETFEWLLEDRLNFENTNSEYKKFEILNFSVAGYSTLQNLFIFENKVLQFNPDAVIYIAHPNDGERLINSLIARVREGIEIPYKFINQIVDEIDLTANTPEITAYRNLKLYEGEIITWTYNRIAIESKNTGASPIFVIIPRLSRLNELEDSSWQIQLAEEAGFTVLDLSDVYSSQNLDDIMLASWDAHPTAAGHQLIANRLYELLLSHRLIPGE